MKIPIQARILEIESPANLRINDQINAYREECRKSGCERPYHHFAFGESPFSPPPTVIEALAANASKHSYLPSGGIVPLRERIARYYNQNFDLDCGFEQIVVGPGSKEMISASLTVLQGVLIVPTPSWVSYLPQARIAGKEVISPRTRREDDYKLTPQLLCRSIEPIRSQPKILLLNHPHNPTGAVYSRDELGALAEICRQEGIIVISDEIYAQTAFDVGAFTSMARLYPEGTIVTGGLSKDRSCGGYRFGLAITPREATDLTAALLKVAGSTYSCVAAPIQYAAMEAYSGKAEIEDHIRDCTRLHALAGRKMSAMFSQIPGVKTTVPRGAFYLYVDFNEQRAQFWKLGIQTCEQFCVNLLWQEHTALLPGNASLLPENDFSVRCCFVDYDGDRALAAWRKKPPSSQLERDTFAKMYFPLLLGGVASIGRYLASIREEKQPAHFDAPAWTS